MLQIKTDQPSNESSFANTINCVFHLNNYPMRRLANASTTELKSHARLAEIPCPLNFHAWLKSHAG